MECTPLCVLIATRMKPKFFRTADMECATVSLYLSNISTCVHTCTIDMTHCVCVCVCVWGGFGRRRKRSANACGGVKRERRKMSARVRDGLCPWSTTLVFEYQCSMLCLSLQKSTPLGNVHV